MKKVLCFMLSLVLSVSLLLSSCNVAEDKVSGTPEPSVEQSSSEPNNTEPSVPSEPETEEETPPKESTVTETDISDTSSELVETDLPPDEGEEKTCKELNVFYANRTYSDLSDDSEAGGVIDIAAYKKLCAIEEELGIDVKLHKIGGGYPELQSSDMLVDTVKNGSSGADIVLATDMYMVEMLLMGLFKDMEQYGAIDWNGEWWPTGAKDSFSLNRRIYFASGELSTNYASNAYGVFVNEDILGTGDGIFKSIEEDTWTPEELMSLVGFSYIDKDGVSGKSDGDVFGIEVTPHALRSIIAGSGFRFAEEADASGEVLQLSYDVEKNPRFEMLIDSMSSWTVIDDVLGFKGNVDEYGTAFLDGRATFIIKELSFAESLKNTDFDWLVVPPPKSDYSLFNGYRTSVSTLMSTTYAAICAKSKYGEHAARLIDAMGKYGMEYTTPAVVETIFEKEWLEADGNAEMLETIIKGVTFDMASVFSLELNIVDIAIMIDVVEGEGLAVMSDAFHKKTIQNSFKKLSEKLLALEDD